MLIPALVVLLGLDMKRAVGTSLLIIAMNSLIGFAGDAGHYPTDWTLLGAITALAVAGVFAGGVLARSIPASHLKIGFGWFVLAMGLYILVKEIKGLS